MGKGSNIDKLYEIAVKASDNWIEIADKLEQEQTWLDKSAKIALSVLSALKDLKMSKQELADKMGVKAQYISRIVKGTENLTLETISKLEKALGKDLMSIPDYSFRTKAYYSIYPKNIHWTTPTSCSFTTKGTNILSYKQKSSIINSQIMS